MKIREKIKLFEIEGKLAKIYIKIPKFMKFEDFFKKIDSKYKQINKTEYEKYIGTIIDETGKYLIVYFVLRNDDEHLVYSQIHNQEKIQLLHVLAKINHENERLRNENKNLKELLNRRR